MLDRFILLKLYIIKLLDDVEKAWKEECRSKRKNKLPQPSILDNKLEEEDWEVLAYFLKCLGPFEQATMMLQGNATQTKQGEILSGAFWRYFLVFEYLFEHVEREKQRVENGELNDLLGEDLAEMVKINLNLCHAKLAKYYDEMRSVTYVAAIVFHPCYGFPAIEQDWSAVAENEEDDWGPHWIAKYKVDLRKLWIKKYKNR